MFSYRSLYFDDPPLAGRALDIFPPDGRDSGTAVFCVHGGGWSSGSRAARHGIMREFGRYGIECASTDYRLAPGELFHQIEDVREGLRIFLRDRRERGLNPRVVMQGGSAGGHLALMVALSAGEEGGEDVRSSISGVAVQAPALTFEPWPDIFPPIWSSMQKAMGHAFTENPHPFEKASPMRHLHAGMPPILILHAEHEHMFPLDIALEFQRKARQLGGSVDIRQYERVEHGFFYSLERRQQKQAFQDILDFLRTPVSY